MMQFRRQRNFVTVSLGLAACMSVLVSCSVHHVSSFDQPAVRVPDHYLREQEGIPVPQQWWKEFNQPKLNVLVEKALNQNLDIKQAWSRLEQARANSCIVASELYPNIDLNGAAEFKTERAPDSSGEQYKYTSAAAYLISPTLAYEVDLWKRIDSKVKAAEFGTCTSVEDLEATAVVLTGALVDLWLSIQELKALLQLIHHQIKVSETLLELVELRFSIGESSALTVYQQRLQYEETRSQLIPVEAALKRAGHQLSVLLGEPPEDTREESTDIFAIELPPYPDIGSPAELLMRRPDLRSAHYKLIAADYEVAAAIADCFPRLTLPALAEFKDKTLSQIFEAQVYKITAKLVAPLFDGGRRRCEVARRKAIVKERIDGFAQRFLNALLEVEDAIVNEESQKELIEQLQLQVDLARFNLEEAHQRYATGLNDYLTVIAAIQSLQRFERRLITEHRQLLVNRSRLYRALGVPCLVGCSDDLCHSKSEKLTDEEEGE